MPGGLSQGDLFERTLEADTGRSPESGTDIDLSPPPSGLENNPLVDPYAPTGSVDTGIGGFNNADLRNLLAEMLNYSIGGGVNPFATVIGADDITNVNPGTQRVLERLLARPSRLPGQSATTGALTSLLGGQLPSFMGSIADRAAQSAGQIYSNAGALYSGPAQQNITRAATQAVGEQTNAFLQTLLGGATSFASTGAGRETSLLGSAAGLAAPSFFEPTVTQNPFFLSPTQAFALDQTGTYAPISAIGSGVGSLASILALAAGG